MADDPADRLGLEQVAVVGEVPGQPGAVLLELQAEVEPQGPFTAAARSRPPARDRRRGVGIERHQHLDQGVVTGIRLGADGVDDRVERHMGVRGRDVDRRLRAAQHLEHVGSIGDVGPEDDGVGAAPCGLVPRALLVSGRRQPDEQVLLSRVAGEEGREGRGHGHRQRHLLVAPELTQSRRQLVAEGEGRRCTPELPSLRSAVIPGQLQQGRGPGQVQPPEFEAGGVGVVTLFLDLPGCDASSVLRSRLCGRLHDNPPTGSAIHLTLISGLDRALGDPRRGPPSDLTTAPRSAGRCRRGAPTRGAACDPEQTEAGRRAPQPDELDQGDEDHEGPQHHNAVAGPGEAMRSGAGRERVERLSFGVGGPAQGVDDGAGGRKRDVHSPRGGHGPLEALLPPRGITGGLLHGGDLGLRRDQIRPRSVVAQVGHEGADVGRIDRCERGDVFDLGEILVGPRHLRSDVDLWCRAQPQEPDPVGVVGVDPIGGGQLTLGHLFISLVGVAGQEEGDGQDHGAQRQQHARTCGAGSIADGERRRRRRESPRPGA